MGFLRYCKWSRTRYALKSRMTVRSAEGLHQAGKNLHSHCKFWAFYDKKTRGTAASLCELSPQSNYFSNNTLHVSPLPLLCGLQMEFKSELGRPGNIVLIFSLEAGRKAYREYKSYLGPWFLKQATIATECERLREEKNTSYAPFSLPVSHKLLWKQQLLFSLYNHKVRHSVIYTALILLEYT